MGSPSFFCTLRKKTAAEDNHLYGSLFVRANTFLNQKSSYLCVLVEATGVEPVSERALR